jgi:hypothetical protein
MGQKEQAPDNQSATTEPAPPSTLPLELASFLRPLRFACLFQATNIGTVAVVKAPRADIASLLGAVAIVVRHELYEHPQAPVIRTVMRLYDRPETPLALETFTNVGDASQRADLETLAGQDDLVLLCYDEELTHRLTKRVKNATKEALGRIVAQADALAAGIDPEQFDFDRAKAAVMEATGL